MNKTKSRPKALNDPKNKGGFFRALIFGFVTCAVVWLIVSLVLSFVMSKQTDSGAFSSIFSIVTVVVSLLSGGFAAGKADKRGAVLSSFVLGCAVLGMCYALSVSLELSMNLSNVFKTFVVALMLVCPVLGARFSTREKKNRRYNRKRM